MARYGYSPTNAATSITVTKHSFGKDAERVTEPDEIERFLIQTARFQIAQFGPRGVQRNVRTPQHAFRSDCTQNRIEHVHVCTAAGEINPNIGSVTHDAKRVGPIPPTTQMSHDEIGG